MKVNRDIFKLDYYLTDGGLETSLIYHQGVQLEHFAAFELMNHEEGREALKKYYNPYLKLAADKDLGFVIETPTWRANPDWGKQLGYSAFELEEINKNAVLYMRELAEASALEREKYIVSGNIGPREDGYFIGSVMSPEEAKVYHQQQVKAFAYADADVITALTMTNATEAIGIVNAARYFGIPVVISFTVETDGRLPSGEHLSDAIQKVDMETSWYVSHYMINCAHPHHFRDKLMDGDFWKNRIKGIRANASCKSHEELDASETLDIGDKQQLGSDYRELGQLLPQLKVIGGCCGTDHSHIEAIYQAFLSDNYFVRQVS